MAGSVDDNVETPGTAEHSDYQAFLDDYSSQFASGEGESFHGHVVRVTDKEVLVDIGRKLEGLVPASQFPLVDGLPAVKRDDVIEVVIDRTGPPVDGYILLSYEKAHRRQIWEQLEQAAAAETSVTGTVTGKIKGGLAVDIGVVAFLPSSQIEIRPIHNLEAYVGQTIEVRILKLNRRRGNAVVSRRVLLESDLQSRKEQALSTLHEGAEVAGVVKNLTEYGAFVDLGGIDGLLHVSDLSYGSVTHPSSFLKAGEEITVKVLKFDREHERISLGLKQMRPDPWANVEERYPPDSRVIGRIVSVTDYGAFVELEAGLEGLIHISEMTWSRRMKHPSKIVNAGDQVEAVILEVKPKERRISLGIKQLEADPWTTIADRYSVGSVVSGSRWTPRTMAGSEINTIDGPPRATRPPTSPAGQEGPPLARRRGARTCRRPPGAAPRCSARSGPVRCRLGRAARPDDRRRRLPGLPGPVPPTDRPACWRWAR